MKDERTHQNVPHSFATSATKHQKVEKVCVMDAEEEHK
jgi:hypothetical protein